jgi:hypothetical protein
MERFFMGAHKRLALRLKKPRAAEVSEMEGRVMRGKGPEKQALASAFTVCCIAP